MAKEDLLLREEMGRLEIEPRKVSEQNNENPFNLRTKRSPHTTYIRRPHVQNTLCACKKNINAKISKKKPNKILKEPVLQSLKSCINYSSLNKKECSSTPETHSVDSLNLCTLVKTCNQLKISNDSVEQNAALTLSNENTWWKNGVNSITEVRGNKEAIQHSQTGSCSQQALNPPCDVTIDELASYFETLVHIPKKMSSMAEMMYI